MRDGPRRFPQNSSCSAVLRCRLGSGRGFRLRGFHPLRPAFPGGSAILARRRGAGPTTPRAPRRARFGLLRVRSPLLAQSLTYFLFLRVLRCFSSPRSPSRQLRECGDRSPRVSPFGHRRITGHLPLPGDFRSLSRPSSPPRAAGIPRAPLLAFALHFFARDRTPSNGARRHARDSFLFARCFSSVLSWCSQHVNELFLVEDNGLEPLTPCLQSRCSTS